MTPSPERIAELRAILDGLVTSLPWTYFVGNANGRGLIRIEAQHDSPEAGTHIASMPRGAISEANAALLVEAVNALPNLLSALEERTKALQAIVDACDRCGKDDDRSLVDEFTEEMEAAARAALAGQEERA
jgi:hypothetical protein